MMATQPVQDTFESYRLLVVDDEVGYCHFIKTVADTLGLDVVTINNPTLLGVEEIHGFDLIILDLHMPEMDGIEIVRMLAAESCQAGILLSSGADKSILNSAQQLAQERGLNVIGAMNKPVRAFEIAERLRNFRPASRDTKDTFKQEISTERLAQAIDKGLITVHYQPQISMVDGAVIGFEALARWTDEEQGPISPGRFIPLAEESGLIGALTDCVMHQSMRDWAVFGAEGADMKLSVNVSAKDLEDVNFADHLVSMLRFHNMNASNLILEVTETAICADYPAFIDVLTRVRMRGIGVAVDDFGIGYSSLRQLVSAPFNEMKIDQSFVSRMLVDNECRTIVASSIALSHELDMFCIAEGIESEAVYNELKSLGCDFAQGYYIARPAPLEEAIDWMKSVKAGS